MAKGSVIVTGVEEELTALASRVRRVGRSPLLLPTIRIEKRPLRRGDLQAIKDLAGYDYLIFTSGHAAAIFGELTKGLRIKKPPHQRVVAVGRATARACARIGFKAQVMPKEFNAEKMLDGLRAIRGKKVLFPRSAIALPESLKRLRAKGASVKAIPLYTTVPIRTDKASFSAIFDEAVDCIVFMSPSSVAGFVKNLSGTILRKRPFETTALCIGPTTARAARKAGFRHIKMPQESTFDGLVEMLS